MTQPAVSNALRRLRDATDEELFIAGPTGMTPTAHAEALWPAVRGALDSLRDAFDPQHFDPRRDAHRFVLSMADATASVLMPRLVAVLDAEAAAQAAVHVVPLATRDPRPLLEQGQADIAVGFFPDVEAALAAEGGAGVCRLQHLYDCEYVCVMRRGHPLAGDAPLTLDDYCDARHLRVSFHGRVHGFVDEALARLGRRRHTLMIVNHFSTAAAVVHDADLLTVLPRTFVPASGLQDGLVIRPVPFELPPIRVVLLWHRRHEHDAAQRWMRAMLVRASRAV
jgi:DNA-binding transcriptional LysR family regulator